MWSAEHIQHFLVRYYSWLSLVVNRTTKLSRSEISRSVASSTRFLHLIKAHDLSRNSNACSSLSAGVSLFWIGIACLYNSTTLMRILNAALPGPTFISRCLQRKFPSELVCLSVCPSVCQLVRLFGKFKCVLVIAVMTRLRTDSTRPSRTSTLLMNS